MHKTEVEEGGDHIDVEDDLVRNGGNKKATQDNKQPAFTATELLMNSGRMPQPFEGGSITISYLLVEMHFHHWLMPTKIEVPWEHWAQSILSGFFHHLARGESFSKRGIETSCKLSGSTRKNHQRVRGFVGLLEWIGWLWVHSKN